MKKPHIVLTAAGLMVLVLLFGAGERRHESVEVVRLTVENWEEFAPRGKEVDAIAGDIVLRNGYLTAVIARPVPTRNANMTVRNVGGGLIDLTVRGEESDQLSAFYPGRRAFPFGDWTVAANDVEVDLETAGRAEGESASVTVHAPAAEGRPAVDVTYSLAADARHLIVTTRFRSTSDEPLTVKLEDDFRADGGKEDMRKSPNGAADLFWIHDRYWGQAYGLEATGRRIESTTNGNTSVLAYIGEDGETSVTIPPGESFELTRRVVPGANLLDVKAVVGELKGTKAYPVRIAVRDGNGDPLAGAVLELSRGGDAVGSARTDAKGRIATALPVGEYALGVTALGVPVAEIEPRPLTIDVEDRDAAQDFDLEFSSFRPGTVVASITDADGEPIPCKVEFLPQGETPRPSFGPETAELGVFNVRYAPHGTFEQQVPPGRYEVVISHGPEHDAVFEELTVLPGERVELSCKLVRSVETAGWVSSDFHSHSSPSGDNTASQRGRVVNLVCEHIEFAPCTEHNRIDTYVPHIEALQLGAFVSTTTGIELTGSPLPLNHQNAFPLVHKPHTQDGGGPQTDDDIEAQIERLALWDDRSDKLVQQNHPDIGWLFYDRNGDGEPDEGFERAHVQIDAMEVHPVHGALDLQPYIIYFGKPIPNRVFAWLQLLNQGYRIPGVVNTDAHYNYHGSGGLRNWIQSSTDDPARIDAMEMVHAAEEGRLVMSNGPFLEVSAREEGGREEVTAGQDLAARSGRLRLRVRVQCPNWLDVDRVTVLVNGRRDGEHDYARDDEADRFRGGTVKFDETLELQLKSDAHVIVVAGGENSKVGRVMGPMWGSVPPAALSNPIYVDVDGDGFRPNKDTLDHPLPVKFK